MCFQVPCLAAALDSCVGVVAKVWHHQTIMTTDTSEQNRVESYASRMLMVEWKDDDRPAEHYIPGAIVSQRPRRRIIAKGPANTSVELTV